MRRVYGLVQSRLIINSGIGRGQTDNILEGNAESRNTAYEREIVNVKNANSDLHISAKGVIAAACACASLILDAALAKRSRGIGNASASNSNYVGSVPGELS